MGKVFMFLPEEMQMKKMAHVQEMMKVVADTVAKFVEQIIQETEHEKANIYSLNIKGDGTLFTLSICNGETKSIVCKAWPYKEFAELMQNKRLELELNMSVRKMIIHSKDIHDKQYYI